jgi:hypothetical protein
LIGYRHKFWERSAAVGRQYNESENDMVLYQLWILAVAFEVRKKDKILNSPNLPRRIDRLALIAVSATGQKMEDK